MLFVSDFKNHNDDHDDDDDDLLIIMIIISRVATCKTPGA